jgi:hypothetical protein
MRYRWLRHNGHMMSASSRIAQLLCLSALLAGCGREAPPSASSAAWPPFAGDGRVGWRGRLPCADCDGIDTSLSLARYGERRDYLLIETFLTQEGGERFVEQGRWRQLDEDLIRLQAADGGERVYALQADGRLQPRDGRGRQFAEREGDFLTPLTMPDGP